MSLFSGKADPRAFALREIRNPGRKACAGQAVTAYTSYEEAENDDSQKNDQRNKRNGNLFYTTW